MLDIEKLRANSDKIAKRLQTRDPSINIDDILKLDEQRRALIQEVEQLKARRNDGSKKVGKLKREGKDTSDLLESLSNLRDEISRLDQTLEDTAGERDHLLSLLPNIPHSSVPIGTKQEKTQLRSYKAKPEREFPVIPHLEVAEEKGILDFRRAARIAGSRFPMYVGKGAQLEMALIQFMFSHQIDNGYTPIIPPFLATSESFYVSSQLPKFADDIYYCERDDLYLNPTAESLLANLHRGEILESSSLPLDYVAYTPCFRREAGTYGEEERGLIRTHQFNKIEMFKFTAPDQSYNQLDTLVADAEGVLQELDIHYRVVLLPTQDLAQQAAKTIDIEVYLPGQDSYYEVSSCSNCEDFQARRGNTRFRPAEDEKPQFVHTLNGSGVATSRLMAAIIENNQTKDGRIVVPKVLQDIVRSEYM